jgi:hypothetical protein
LIGADSGGMYMFDRDLENAVNPEPNKTA